MTTPDKSMTDEERRHLTGDGKTVPPGLALPSTSEGDMRKNSFRLSKFGRMFTQAVSNDDGTPVNAATEELLADLLDLVQGLRDRESYLSSRAVSAVVENEPFVAGHVNRTPVQAVPGIGTGVAYASGDAFGTRIRFGVPVEGTITNVIFLDNDDEGINKDLVLFEDEFGETADNAAFAVSDADLLRCVGVAHINSWANYANNQVGMANPGLGYSTKTGVLHAQLVTRGADNIAAGQLPYIFLVIAPQGNTGAPSTIVQGTEADGSTVKG